MIGLDRVTGWFSDHVVPSETAVIPSERSESRDLHLSSTPQKTVAELAPGIAARDVTVVDVRGASEYAEGHIPGVANIPLAELQGRLAEIPTDKPIVLHCQGGGRSAIASSVLKANGFSDVSNLTGGYGAWKLGSESGA